MICEDCGRSANGSRSDARYCSNACRQRAYRERSKPRPSPDRVAEMLAHLDDVSDWFAGQRGEPVTGNSRNGETT